MTNITSDLKVVAIYLDDILVSGVDFQDHLSNLNKLLDRLQEKGLRCNLQKCVFAESKIEYLGHVISKEGISKSSKTEKCLRVSQPRNIHELRVFLGGIQFYNKFVPNLASIAAPLYELTRREAFFRWSVRQKEAFEKLLAILSSDKVLVHFDLKVPIGIACDASTEGVGAVLFHRFPDGSERPITYASKILNSTQQKYSQIQKEAFSIIFALVKFHCYLYGRKFILITDHKPFLTIFSPLPSGKSPSELLNGRQTRTWIDTLKDSETKLQREENQQFPHKYRFIKLNEKCYVINYCVTKEKPAKWLKGTITQILGSRHI
ncbi:Retrovirus-related Pol polyprotein from transposon opus [Thelohanellus kitauei]|uniref:Retrovirus-related Pol polyprotein from transposon opus n=1 Tax=Thelohanellus kitauei TaxID=669202 RepID=A0A0C2J2D3_THEKT|nr:Retrovirus-related Pol polyprotein from transposon opus [Thelohanellus kitauei]